MTYVRSNADHNFTFHIVDCLMNFFIRSILQEIVVVGYSMLNIQNNNSAKSLWRKSKLDINCLIKVIPQYCIAHPYFA